MPLKYKRVSALPVQTEEPGTLRKYAPHVVRGAAGFFGLTPVTGAVAGAAGEIIAELIEKGTLDPRELDIKRIGAEALVGATGGAYFKALKNLINARKIGAAAFRGGLYGGAAPIIRHGVEEGEMAPLSEIATGTALGGVTGGGMAKLLGPKIKPSPVVPPSVAPSAITPSAYQGIKGLRIALEDLSRAPLSISKLSQKWFGKAFDELDTAEQAAIQKAMTTPEDLAKHLALAKEQARDPLGQIASEIGPPLKEIGRTPAGEPIWAKPSLVDYEEIAEGTAALRARESIAAEKAFNAAMKEKVAAAKAQEAAVKMVAKEKAAAEQATAMAKLEESLTEEVPPRAITEAITVPGEYGGKARATFRRVAPEPEEGAELVSIQKPKTPSVTAIAAGTSKLTPDIVAMTAFSTKKEASQALVRAGKSGSVERLKRGNWVVRYVDEPVPPPAVVPEVAPIVPVRAEAPVFKSWITAQGYANKTGGMVQKQPDGTFKVLPITPPEALGAPVLGRKPPAIPKPTQAPKIVPESLVAPPEGIVAPVPAQVISEAPVAPGSAMAKTTTELEKFVAEQRALPSSPSRDRRIEAALREINRRAGAGEFGPGTVVAAQRPLSELAAAEKTAWDDYYRLKKLLETGKATAKDVKAAGKTAGEVRATVNQAAKAAKEAGEPIPPSTKARLWPDEMDSDEIIQLTSQEQKLLLSRLEKKFGKGGRGTIVSMFGAGQFKDAMRTARENPAFATKLISGLAGSATGAAYYEDDPVAGAFVGAGLGLAGGAVAHRIPEVIRGDATIKEITDTITRRISSWVRSALLSDPRSMFHNSIAGPWGSGTLGGIEQYAKGLAKGDEVQQEIGKIILARNLNIPEWMRGWYDSLGEAASRITSVEELGRAGSFADPSTPAFIDMIMRIPGVYMLAGDLNMQHILMEAGVPREFVKRITLTAQPRRALWQTIANWGKARSGVEGKGETSSLALLMLPFKRTAANIMESGTERTPILGSIINYMGDETLKIPYREQFVQEGIGATVWGLAFAAGQMTNEEMNKSLKIASLVSNLGGQYSLLASTGFLAGQMVRTGKSTPEAAARAFLRNYTGRGELPLPTAAPLEQAGRPVLRVATGEGAFGELLQVPRIAVPRIWTAAQEIAKRFKENKDLPVELR